MKARLALALGLTSTLVACSTPPPNLIVDECNGYDDDDDGRTDEGTPAELGCGGAPCVAGRCARDSGLSDAGGRRDAGRPDAGRRDAGPPDAGRRDAGRFRDGGITTCSMMISPSTGTTSTTYVGTGDTNGTDCSATLDDIDFGEVECAGSLSIPGGILDVGEHIGTFIVGDGPGGPTRCSDSFTVNP